MRCKSFKDDPNISPVDHSPDQPNTLHLSKKSTTFGDNILPKQNNMTRILNQNSGSLDISNNSHKLEVICEAMYNHEVDIETFVETNTHGKHENHYQDLIKS